MSLFRELHERSAHSRAILASTGSALRFIGKDRTGAVPGRVISRFSEGFVEGVAGSADGSDGIAFAAAGERLAQAPDVDVDRAFVDLRRLPPHAIQQLRAREHPAGLLQEIFEQPELGRAEMDVARAAPHPPRLPVEIEIARIETLGDPLWPAAAQKRA